MAKKLKDGRKRGSGLNRKYDYPLKKGSYKIYGLLDPDTKDIMFIGLSKNWLCRSLSFIIYGSLRLNYTGAVNEWIRELDRVGKRPLIEMIELLKTSDKKEAVRRCNEYKNLYGILNKKYEYREKKDYKKRIYNKVDKRYIEQAIRLYNEGLGIQDIVRSVGISNYIIRYYLIKNNYTKKNRIEEENNMIKHLIDRGSSVKQISFIMGKSVRLINYRIKNNVKLNVNR